MMPFMDERIEWHEWFDTMNVQLDEGAVMPTRAHEGDAGFDLYVPDGITQYLWHGDSLIIDTGVHIEIPQGYCGMLMSKSGLNTKFGVTTTGLVDSGYTGSIKVKMYNHGTERLTIEPGDKISQIVIVPCMTPKLNKVNKLSKSDRGNNGFGSSGRK